MDLQPAQRCNLSLKLILSPQSQQPDLEEALDFSNNTEELLIAFKALEATLSENDKRLGSTCLRWERFCSQKGPKS
ncbi:hypothetical protein IEQ34_015210 [Dendrobium chrysotoxum]|uniref:Uncharacterized protein n=1 Tax=Dendrobium chrysotoxum TaxID=161865 RepID=A0AAV7GID5_DENCH|nr:hypothetical protein IEQ34_015210 [Dendrobium chrysotoxum]